MAGYVVGGRVVFDPYHARFVADGGVAAYGAPLYGDDMDALIEGVLESISGDGEFQIRFKRRTSSEPLHCTVPARYVRLMPATAGDGSTEFPS